MVERSRVRWLRRWAVSLLVGVVALRLLGPAWTSHYNIDFPDTASYFAVARRSPFSWTFWFGQRPPTYPALLWLLRGSHLGVVTVQTALAFAAWIWLCLVLATSTRRKWLSYPGIVIVIAIAVQARWIFWNTLVLTESLSITLSVAMIAAWLRWWAEPTRKRTIGLALIIVAWMCLRDSNAMTWLVVAIPTVIVAAILLRRAATPRRRGAVLILGLSVVAGGYSTVAQLVTDRGETSFHNNVGLRWLPDPSMTEFMVKRGMPLDEALVNQTGDSAWDNGDAFLVAPDLAPYRRWADSAGRSAAVESFVLRAPWYIGRFSEQVGVYAEPLHLLAYDNYGVGTRFPEQDLGPLEPVRSLRSLIVWGIIGTGAVALVLVSRRALGLVLALSWFAVIVDVYLSYCADAIEVGRHLVGPWLRFSVLSVVAIVLGLDTLLTVRAERSMNDANGGALAASPIDVEADDSEAVVGDDLDLGAAT